MLYWTHYRMSDGRFRPKWVFKCDDDNFIDIFEFESYLHTLDKLNGANIICSKREEAVPSRLVSLQKIKNTHNNCLIKVIIINHSSSQFEGLC